MSSSENAVCFEFSAPPGWKKKLTPKKGGTPKKDEIIFTSPTGEEFNNKDQLEQYLKSHPDGPVISEFDWGTGETLRRSSRISEKVKAAPPLESASPKKRSKQSLASKEKEKETNLEETMESKEGDTEKKDGAGSETAQNVTKESEDDKGGPDSKREIEGLKDGMVEQPKVEPYGDGEKRKDENLVGGEEAKKDENLVGGEEDQNLVGGEEDQNLVGGEEDQNLVGGDETKKDKTDVAIVEDKNVLGEGEETENVNTVVIETEGGTKENETQKCGVEDHTGRKENDKVE